MIRSGRSWQNSDGSDSLFRSQKTIDSLEKRTVLNLKDFKQAATCQALCHDNLELWYSAPTVLCYTVLHEGSGIMVVTFFFLIFVLAVWYKGWGGGQWHHDEWRRSYLLLIVRHFFKDCKSPLVGWLQWLIQFEQGHKLRQTVAWANGFLLEMEGGVKIWKQPYYDLLENKIKNKELFMIDLYPGRSGLLYKWKVYR